MRTKEDFLSLLNCLKVILYGDKSQPFDIIQLNYYIQNKSKSKKYVQFRIPKKSGEERIINAPCKGLKQIQYCLNTIFQLLYTPHTNAFGFIPGKSIVDNAQKHTGNLYVYNIDLKDFFSSIDQARIWKRLQYPPFCLSEETNKMLIANMIATLCCHAMIVERQNKDEEWSKVKKNVLPQGAPTSPILTNIICERLDYLLSGVAKRFGLRYSRYADDITFSSMHDVYGKDSDFNKELVRIIQEQGFAMQSAKTRLQKTGHRQEVTGLVVSDRINVQQRYIKELRKWLYYWETYGYAKTYTFFCPRYMNDKGNVKKGEPDMSNILAGKLEYLKMVKGYSNPTYMKLKERFDKLTDTERKHSLITTTLNIWENKNIHQAMKFYYGKMGVPIIVEDSSEDWIINSIGDLF